MGISCYSDRNAVDKRLGVNKRVTQILHAAGHTTAQIHGGAFLSRYQDNEMADIWKRVDFKLADASPKAKWTRDARKKGGGGGQGGSGSSLSGLVNKMSNTNVSKPASVGSGNNNNNSSGGAQVSEVKSEDSTDDKISWTQDSDDVDIVIPVPAETKKNQIQINFSKTTLKVSVSGQVLVDGTSQSFEK